MGLGLSTAQRKRPGSTRVPPAEGLWPVPEGGQRANLAPGRQALQVKVAAAPMQNQLP